MTFGSVTVNPGLYQRVEGSRVALDGTLSWRTTVPLAWRPDGINASSDKAGGMYLTWRYGAADGPMYDVLGLHLDALGQPMPGWPATGLTICADPGQQESPHVAASALGAVFVWQDLRGGARDLYCQAMTPEGQMRPGFTLNGAVLCDAAGDQDEIVTVADGEGGVVIVWRDRRSDGGK